MAFNDVIAVGPMNDPDKPPHSFVIIGRRRVWQVCDSAIVQPILTAPTLWRIGES